MKTTLTASLITLLFILLAQQNSSARNHPQSEFQNPLNIPIALAGSFAECRPNHFHTGIDLKSNNKENLQVLAAADGYISRITVSHSGYGNCLYMTHPNGYTTVYGHLNDFVPELMAYLKQQQYTQQKWNVDIQLPIDSFRFKQGIQIAFSGNTGGSMAPHLHFEIRDSKTEQVFNPLLFGLPVTDNVAPKAKQLAYYNAAAYYNSKPNFVNLDTAADNVYTPTITKLAYPKAFVGVDVQDFVNGSSNWLGIKNLQLFVDEKLVTDIAIEGIFFNQNRAINAYADYGTFKNRNIWFQGLYKLKNNPLEVYNSILNNGIIDLSDGAVHQIRIVMKDAFNNASQIKHSLQYQKGAVAPAICKSNFKAGENNFYKHYTSNIELAIPAQCLYDDVCLRVKERLKPKGYSNIFEVLNANIPSHDYFDLKIRLNRAVPQHLENKLVFVHKIANTNLPGAQSQDAQAAELVGNYAKAKVRSFGQYYVAVDTAAPVVKRVNTNSSKKIQISATDNLTKVKSLNVFINGKWACFSRIGNEYFYTLTGDDPKGKLNINVVATDDNANERKLSFVVYN